MTEDLLKKTSLHAFHCEHGARMVPFGGWDMPVQYTGILAEHLAVRNAAGLFDVSHMGEATVVGPEARRFLDHLVTNNVSKMTPGRVLYTPMCYPSGTVVDDLLIYCRGEKDFLLCINAGNTAKDIAWMQDQVAGFDCEVEDVSAKFCQLALQGPRAETILQKLTDTPLNEIAYYHFKDGTVCGDTAILSRTGYTGEEGFEVYAGWDRGATIAEAILAAGKDEGLVLVGLGARDSLRLEAGFPLYGHEISDVITPLEGGIGWTVKLQKDSDFIGRDALARQKADGIPRQVAYFVMNDRRIARAGAPVFEGETVVGEVVSGTQSPVLNQPIGSALIKADFVSSANLEVDLRGKRYGIKPVKPPIHKNA
ncbi:MAG: glycine cleavage system aminomethyltransferase GcvT [Verrucomicrobiae bacterium]|nr:glycine cleavage system aminomethyltransferase GcvT [Verrucomicrobiae bacterium]